MRDRMSTADTRRHDCRVLPRTIHNARKWVVKMIRFWNFERDQFIILLNRNCGDSLLLYISRALLQESPVSQESQRKGLPRMNYCLNTEKEINLAQNKLKGIMLDSPRKSSLRQWTWDNKFMALEFDILIRLVASIFPLVYKAGFSKSFNQIYLNEENWLLKRQLETNYWSVKMMEFDIAEIWRKHFSAVNIL